VRGTELIGGFIKYAGVIGAIGALITLGVWGVGDYLAAKSVHRAMSANTSDAAVAASLPDPHGFPNAGTPIASQPVANSRHAVRVDNVAHTPTRPSKVQRRPQHAVPVFGKLWCSGPKQGPGRLGLQSDSSVATRLHCGGRM